MDKPSLMDSLTRHLLAADEAFRREHPSRFADNEVFYIENVARMLGCSVDQARRIPRNELPAYDGPGKRLLYLREDVLRYVRSRRTKDNQADQRTARIQSAPPLGFINFDAAAEARRLRKGETK